MSDQEAVVSVQEAVDLVRDGFFRTSDLGLAVLSSLLVIARMPGGEMPEFHLSEEIHEQIRQVVMALSDEVDLSEVQADISFHP